MHRVGAVVTAGGKGRRIRELGQEKPMIELLGRPLIDYVLDALSGSDEVSELVVSVSGATPRTERHVCSLGHRVVRTPGEGYVQDLGYAMCMLSRPYVLVVPADMPLLLSSSIDSVVTAFCRSKKSSLVVGVPVESFAASGARPTMSMGMNRRLAVPCGISVVDRELMLKGGTLDEAYMVTDLPEFAVNVNTVEDLRVAERLLKEREVSISSP